MNVNNLLTSTKNVYEHIVDEKSKMIYDNRVLYSLTDDISYIRIC